MIEFLPPPYRVPKLHPHNYYKAKEMKEQSVQDKETEGPVPLVRQR